MAPKESAATLAEIMSRRLVAIDGRKSVRQAVALMVREDVGSVFVRAQGRVVGILTERDVLRAALAEREVFDNPVHAIMSSPLFTLPSTASPLEAFEMMSRNGVRRVPVTVQDRVRGIVTQRDLVDWLLKEPDEIPRLLAGSRPTLARDTLKAALEDLNKGKDGHGSAKR